VYILSVDYNTNMMEKVLMGQWCTLYCSWDVSVVLRVIAE